jgi:hypothetical protein
MPISFGSLPTACMHPSGSLLRHGAVAGRIWMARFLAPLSLPVARPNPLVASPRRLSAGRAKVQTGNRPDTPLTPIHGLAVRSPRRLPGGRVSLPPPRPAPQVFLDSRWRIASSPRKLTPGWAKTPHTRVPAQPGTPDTPLRGLIVRSPRRLPGGKSSPGSGPRADSAILPRRGIATRSPRRMRPGLVELGANPGPPVAFGAGTPIHGILVTSPRRLTPGWAHSPHTAHSNPSPPPTFSTPLHAALMRAIRRMTPGRVLIPLNSRPDVPGTILRGLLTRGGTIRQPGRTKPGRATTQFLNTPLHGLMVAGKRPWRPGRITTIPHSVLRNSDPGTPIHGLMIRSPRRLTPGRAAQAQALARIQPYTLIKGLMVSVRRPLARGGTIRPPFRPPLSTPGMILQWHATKSPRRLRQGWAHVPHTIESGIMPITPGTMLRGLSVRSPRKLSAGRPWQASLTPHALGGYPLRVLRVASPRRLTSGQAKPGRILLPSTVTTVRSWKVISRPPIIRPGKIASPRGVAIPPIVARFFGTSRPTTSIVRPRRGRAWLQIPAPNATPGPPPAALTIREAVAAKLNALASLTSIIGPRIYWSDASQQMVYPCIVCTVESREFGHNHSGADGTSTAQFSFVAMSQGNGSEQTCVAIVKAIRIAFDNFMGVQSGVQFLRTFITAEPDAPVFPPDGSDYWIYTITGEYEIVHRLPFPTTVTQTDV